MDVLPMLGNVDPSQYILPWDTVFESLTLIILLAFIVERILALFFESPQFVQYVEQRKADGGHSPKSFIAGIVSIGITILYKIDIVAILVGLPQVSVAGCVITGLLVAGGSKASIKLFRDFLDVKSNAYRDAESAAPPPKKPNPPKTPSADSTSKP